MNGNTDFSMGRGQENLDVTGPTPLKETNVLSENYDETTQKELQTSVPLTDEERSFIDNLPDLEKEVSQNGSKLKNFIGCIMGTLK